MPLGPAAGNTKFQTCVWRQRGCQQEFVPRKRRQTEGPVMTNVTTEALHVCESGGVYRWAKSGIKGRQREHGTLKGSLWR
jgi:hypothetical protein